MTDRPDARPLELVSHAILAPSSHNTQCWLFRLGPDHIAIPMRTDRLLRFPADPHAAPVGRRKLTASSAPTTRGTSSAPSFSETPESARRRDSSNR